MNEYYWPYDGIIKIVERKITATNKNKKKHKETYYFCLQINFPKFLSSIYPHSNFGEIGFTHKAVL